MCLNFNSLYFSVLQVLCFWGITSCSCQRCFYCGWWLMTSGNIQCFSNWQSVRYVIAFCANSPSAAGKLQKRMQKRWMQWNLHPWCRWQKHQFYWSGGPLHFHISSSQPERSMEITIKQSLSLMWFNKVPLKNNNAEDSEGVLRQPILSVWSGSNVYCKTSQRILNLRAFCFFLFETCLCNFTARWQKRSANFQSSYGYECWRIRLLSFMCYVSYIIFWYKEVLQLIK